MNNLDYDYNSIIADLLSNLDKEINAESIDILYNDDADFLHDSDLSLLNKHDFHFCCLATVQLIKSGLESEAIHDYLLELYTDKLNTIGTHIVAKIGDCDGTVKYACEYARVGNLLKKEEIK